MRPINRLLTLLLIAALMITAIPAVTYAADTAATGAESTIVGDVDGDGAATIDDVSYLQGHLAKILTLSAKMLVNGDVDLDGSADAADVTLIQRWLARFSGEYYVSMTVAEAKKKAGIVTPEPTVPTTPPAPTTPATPTTPSGYEEIMNAINSFERAKGVDISEFNGDVDMNKLKQAGFTFVIIRLGYGDDDVYQDDNMFETNVKKAEAAGLDWGAYIYSYALTEREAKSEVAHTLRLLKGKKPTMPIAFDWEEDDYKYRNGMPSDENVRKICYTYLSGIEAAGYYPILYTGYNWLMGAFNHPDIDRYDVWLAQWSSTYDYTRRPLGMWQYGGEVNYLEPTTIDGLSGSFDKDFSYKNYPMIIKAYGYNNHTALLPGGIAKTAAAYEPDGAYAGENLPPECNGVMGDSLRR